MTGEWTWFEPRCRLALPAAMVALAGGAWGGIWLGSARADETVLACGAHADESLYGVAAFGINPSATCPVSGGLDHGFVITTPGNTVADGARGYWITNTPAGLTIDDATVPSISAPFLNDEKQYGGGFFWGPGNSDGAIVTPFSSSASYGVAYATPGFPSTNFGFQVVCGANPCTVLTGTLEVSEVDLTVGETQGPSISAGGLWGEKGWVRGLWPITVDGDSPSGVCSLTASLASAASDSKAFPQDTSAWHQCDASADGGLSKTLNTAAVADGAEPLQVSDQDAAGLTNSASDTIHVDNQPPTVSLSGPSYALSTAGTQTITASVGAGPSGAYGASCSVDGGPGTLYPGTTASVPVSGIGPHTITCSGENNALAANGQRASSAPESFSLTIQQPTAAAITFSHIADKLRCRTVVRRVKVLGRRHTIRLHGHQVSVRRIRHVKRHVRKCHARTARRRVLVVLKHRGKPVRDHHRLVRVRRFRRVALLPHRVDKRTRHVRHGHRTTVRGFLGLAGGVALPKRTVTVLGAANNSARRFHPLATATTDADGLWVAHIPKGPSRLLEADYGGDPTTAAALSTTVRTIVPAKVRILKSTRRVAWGRTARFVGRVYGGHIPRGGINLRLRYGYRHHAITYGVKTHVGHSGRFRTTFTFGPGDPRDHLRFHFQFATLPGGDYPFHGARSNTVTVRVGGHPRGRGG